MRHLLVSTTVRHALADELRIAAPASTTVLSAHGMEATLDTLARSARIDAVVTDDPMTLTEIFHEIPGAMPVYLARDDESAADVLRALDEMER